MPRLSLKFSAKSPGGTENHEVLESNSIQQEWFKQLRLRAKEEGLQGRITMGAQSDENFVVNIDVSGRLPEVDERKLMKAFSNLSYKHPKIGALRYDRGFDPEKTKMDTHYGPTLTSYA